MMMMMMMIKMLLISDEWFNVNVVLIQMIVKKMICNVMTIIFDVCDNDGNGGN
jgi:hypothetical protein